MTVKELIEILKDIPEDYKVYPHNHHDIFYGDGNESGQLKKKNIEIDNKEKEILI